MMATMEWSTGNVFADIALYGTIVVLYALTIRALYLIGRDATDAVGWRRIPAGFKYVMHELENRFVRWSDEFVRRNKGN